jgi:hypothetical protein
VVATSSVIMTVSPGSLTDWLSSFLLHSTGGHLCYINIVCQPLFRWQRSFPSLRSKWQPSFGICETVIPLAAIFSVPACALRRPSLLYHCGIVCESLLPLEPTLPPTINQQTLVKGRIKSNKKGCQTRVIGEQTTLGDDRISPITSSHSTDVCTSFNQPRPNW